MMERYGVDLEDLRLYQDLGLLQPVTTDRGYRYSKRDCVKLEIILKGLQLGFTLEEIGALISVRLIETVVRGRDGLDAIRLIEELRTLLLRQGLSDVSVDEIRTLLQRD